MKTRRQIVRRAIMLSQAEGHPLYLFAMLPDEFMKVASISRVARNETDSLVGYQRKEVQHHVKEILSYLDGPGVLFPNAIILAFDESIRFTRSRGPSKDDGLGTAGTLEIAIPREEDHKPAWIVDGQQRALALSRTSRTDLAVPVVAISCAQLDVQRDQFLRVNNTKPLPKGLITELLPEVDTYLPRRIAARKLPSALCDILNRHPESPFKGLIKRPSTPPSEARTAIVTDTALVDMLRARIYEASGCLFPYRNVATGETDTDTVQRVLIGYWRAVARTFPDAWALPPNRSRLMHGVGIRAMGHLMDVMSPRVDPDGDIHTIEAESRRELARVARLCAWTDGTWSGINDAPWNAFENTSRSIRLLSNYLVREYTLALRRA
jgi:DGQHR domain-containing protein